MKFAAWLLTGLVLAMPVSAAVFTVNSTADVAVGVPGNCVADGPSLPNTCRLRDAIAAASNGDTIVFDPLLAHSVITLTGGELILNKSGLTIDGAPGIAIDAGGISRVFQVPTGFTGIELKNLAIRNGHTGGGGNNHGGNVYNAGTLTLIHCSVFDGRLIANNNGGGIYNTGTLTLIGSTVWNNETASNVGGGGIYSSGTLTLANSTVSGNSSNNTGGGIYNTGTLTLLNATVAGNSGGGDIHNTAASSDFRVANTIVQTCSGTTGADDGGNLAADGTCSFTAATSINNANLALGQLQDNGGATLTMMPGVGSAAIGRGLASVCANPPVNGVDQRGFLRAVPPTACTSGAVEFKRTLDVDVTGGGHVDETPAGHIDKSADTPVGNECTNTYSHGATVTLTATPPSVNHSVTWGGHCAVTSDPLQATVLMDADKTCTATFALLQRTLDVDVTGGGHVDET
ncbi:MAG: hypothetical protein LBE32_01125, partial [Burkholderiales bacterium]|nr:hypothetical protein [Burkholderiales bacterium]